MIYMRNITITTAKSATYLENVGEGGFHGDVGPEEREPFRPGKPGRLQRRMAEVVVADIEYEILDLGRAARAPALRGRAIGRKNNETIVISIGLGFICELGAVQIAAFGKLFAKIENAGPNPQVLCPCAKVDDLGHGTLCKDKP